MKEKLYKALFQFFHDMTLNELRLMNRQITDQNITYNTFLYYDLVATHQGEYTASQIADLLHVSKPAVITKVNEMIKLGYLYKKQSTTDKRVYYLFAYEDGVRDEFLYQKMDHGVVEALMEKYSKSDLETFCDIMYDIGALYLNKGENLAK